ncbi:hypothetical protein [uncultured Draconibacterium sp.]|uniref:hypothetical protein n=1 Tax=uncultured Draconibacterium sp. TaxID=1573823 RepID=UPI002606884E|nr:hypothetical protein [uncultured Draconibacterium sp.]
MKKLDQMIELSKSFELLNEIRDMDNGLITSKEFTSGYKIHLEPNKRGIKFTLFHDSLIFEHDKLEFRNLEIIQNDLNIKIPYLFLSEKTGGQVSGKIPAFEYGDFDKINSTYHRLALPLNQQLDFMFSVENVLLDYYYESGIHTREATEIKIENHIFHFFVAKNKIKEIPNRDYLVLESKTPMSYSEFSEFCFSILVSFGFVSGDFINDDGYFFQYENSCMTEVVGIAYRQLRGSIKCQYVPIYSNPMGYIHDSKKADLYRDKVRTLNLAEFSKLCQYCYSNDDIKSILLLLIEVQTQTLVSGPGILSIALETLANVIYEENESTLAPVKSKSTSKKLRKELLKTVDNFNSEIEEEGIKILKSRIDQINQRTNREKLLIPFNILEIPIFPVDVEAIEQRNAFLHGRTPMAQEVEPKSINEADKFRYYLYLKLYVLVSSVVMKYIGFDNLVVNYPKIYENSTGIKLDEEYYRQI